MSMNDAPRQFQALSQTGLRQFLFVVVSVALLWAGGSNRLGNYANDIVRIIKPASQPTVQPVIVTPTSSPPCARGSVLNIVAHQDDDLLFMNPDLMQEIDGGDCVRTIYLTAGDDGRPKNYWYSRQLGSQAAYASMENLPDIWQSRDLTIQGHRLTFMSLAGTPRVSLIFMNLPDGNLQGQGFTRTKHESLSKLRTGAITKLQAIDGTGSYSKAQLVSTLHALMEKYKPSQINTTDYSVNLNDGDHSDHHAAGYFTKQAFARYDSPGSLSVYAGYTVRALPPDLSGWQADNKRKIFLNYELHDPAICADPTICAETPGYSDYFSRQYKRLVTRGPENQAADNAPGLVRRIPQVPSPNPTMLWQRP